VFRNSEKKVVRYDIEASLKDDVGDLIQAIGLVWRKSANVPFNLLLRDLAWAGQGGR
jgi:hypothetical protein